MPKSVSHSVFCVHPYMYTIIWNINTFKTTMTTHNCTFTEEVNQTKNNEQKPKFGSII